MILADIGQYIREKGQASLYDLSVHFGSEPEAMRGMLERWTSKGKVVRTDNAPSCGCGCSGCSCDGRFEIYIWRG